MREPEKEKDLHGDLEKLIDSGKKKGFLTYDEVNQTLSDSIDSSEEIDQVFEILDGKGIRVIDTEENAEGEPQQQDGEAEETREQQLRRVREENRDEDD